MAHTVAVRQATTGVPGLASNIQRSREPITALHRTSNAASILPCRCQYLAPQWASAFCGRPVAPLRSCPPTRRQRTSAPRCQAEPELSPDNCSVLVAGGGGVGMEVVRLLANAGSWVTVFQRHERYRGEIEKLGSILEVGDLMKPETIAKAIKNKELDVVVSTAGTGLAHQGNPEDVVDSQGNINLINAARKAGVKKFVLVTSIGAGNSRQALTNKELDVLGDILKEKTRAEDHLRDSGMQWTIIRPGGLRAESASGKAVLTEDPSVLGLISRADVASLVVKCLFDPEAEGKVLSAVDLEQLKGKAKDFEQFVVR